MTVARRLYCPRAPPQHSSHELSPRRLVCAHRSEAPPTQADAFRVASLGGVRSTRTLGGTACQCNRGRSLTRYAVLVNWLVPCNCVARGPVRPPTTHLPMGECAMLLHWSVPRTTRPRRSGVFHEQLGPPCDTVACFAQSRRSEPVRPRSRNRQQCTQTLRVCWHCCAARQAVRPLVLPRGVCTT